MPTLSVAVRVVTGTASDVEVLGIVKVVTVGGVMSGSIIVVATDFDNETLPAASLAHA